MDTSNLVWLYQYKFLVSYSAINSVCFIVLAITLLKMKIGTIKIPYSRYLSTNIIFIFIVNTIDTIWKWIETVGFMIPINLAINMNTLYFIAIHLMYYYLFLYFYSTITNTSLSNIKTLCIGIPTMVMILLNVLNYYTKILFYITPDMKYMRGPLYLFEYVVPYTYLIIPYIKGFGLFIKEKRENIPVKKLHRDVLTIPFAIGVSGTIGMFYTTLPLLSIALALTTAFLYVDLVEDFVTIDPISSLPNKIEFINELQNRISLTKLHNTSNLYIIVIDIMHLKTINEKYGYNEGDNVIRRVANILRRNSIMGDKLNIFICRYSGTQFVAVVNSDSVEDIISYCSSLQLKIDKSDAINLCKYHTEVMYGFSKYNDHDHINDLIEEAMSNLEINKFKYDKIKDTIKDIKT